MLKTEQTTTKMSRSGKKGRTPTNMKKVKSRIKELINQDREMSRKGLSGSKVFQKVEMGNPETTKRT